MSGYPEAFRAHLASGATTVCRAYAVQRRDGIALGFTDHDRDLAFDGLVFRADTGMTARALSQATGLSVDNTEAFGALSDAAIREADLLAGRYDGAEVRIWQVNWADVTQRALVFRGTLGEVTRSGVAFSAEMRGLAEGLNQEQGLVFHNRCSAVLGDARCRVDLDDPAWSAEAVIAAVSGARQFTLGKLGSYAAGWFRKGRLTVLDGPAAGLSGVIRQDAGGAGAERVLDLWQALGADPRPGDRVRVVAGCDRRAATCRLKFDNFLNFRGFPDIPGEDWLMAYPVWGAGNDGGSRRS